MKLQLTAQHLELNDDIKKYVNKKINKLSRFVPRHAKSTAHVLVVLKQQKGKSANPFSCEAIVTLPHERFTVEEATMNIFAAVDIVEAKLKNSLRKYKEKHDDKRSDKRRILDRFRRLADRDFWGSQN